MINCQPVIIWSEILLKFTWNLFFFSSFFHLKSLDVYNLPPHCVVSNFDCWLPLMLRLWFPRFWREQVIISRRVAAVHGCRNRHVRQDISRTLLPRLNSLLSVKFITLFSTALKIHFCVLVVQQQCRILDIWSGEFIFVAVYWIPSRCLGWKDIFHPVKTCFDRVENYLFF